MYSGSWEDNYSWTRWSNAYEQVENFNLNKSFFHPRELNYCFVNTVRYAKGFFGQEREYTRLTTSLSGNPHVWTIYNPLSGGYVRVDEKIARALERKWQSQGLGCVIN